MCSLQLGDIKDTKAGNYLDNAVIMVSLSTEGK